MITNMKVNGQSIDISYIDCLEKKVTSCPYEPAVYRGADNLANSYYKTITGDYSLFIKLFITADNADELRSRIYKFSQIYKCEIDFSNDNKIYDCMLINSSTRILSPKSAFLDLEYQCQIYGDMQTINITSNNQTVTIDGARETYINFEIKAKENLTDYIVNGFKVKSLPINQTVIIDSINKIVDLSKVDIVNFSKGLGAYTVTADTSKADIKLHYRARW